MHVVKFISLVKFHIFMTINISDMMTKSLKQLKNCLLSRELAKKMRDANVSSLVVVDSEGMPVA